MKECPSNLVFEKLKPISFKQYGNLELFVFLYLKIDYSHNKDIVKSGTI